jgi:hypothetical protein
MYACYLLEPLMNTRRSAQYAADAAKISYLVPIVIVDMMAAKIRAKAVRTQRDLMTDLLL